MAAVSRAAGLSPSTLSNALSRPWPKGEILIGQAIGVHPAEIWRSRYYDPKTHQLVERRTQIIRCKLLSGQGISNDDDPARSFKPTAITYSSPAIRVADYCYPPAVNR